MKTRTKIATLTLALVLVGTIAYAASDRRRQAKPDADESDRISEEDALRAELLAATDDHREALAKTAAVTPNRGANDEGGIAKDIETATEQ